MAPSFFHCYNKKPHETTLAYTSVSRALNSLHYEPRLSHEFLSEFVSSVTWEYLAVKYFCEIPQIFL